MAERHGIQRVRTFGEKINLIHSFTLICVLFFDFLRCITFNSSTLRFLCSVHFIPIHILFLMLDKILGWHCRREYSKRPTNGCAIGCLWTHQTDCR